MFTDFDNDDDLDLFVNHDFGFKATPDVFLVNEYPQKTFTEMSEALNMDLKINAMGTAIGDYDNDGWFDYYVTNIRFNQFMVNQGNGKPFLEKSKELGVGYISISWGANFADFDHDMDLDLYVANGDLNPNDVPLADYYFENDKNAFTEIAPVVGLNDYGIGRGSVVFDMDNDGDLDILVVNQKAVLDYPVSSFTRLYRNDSTNGNWVKIALKGVESELNGLGSRVRVVIGKTSMIREIDGGSSHLSQNSTIAHFGLGQATQIDSVIVTWVGGKEQVLVNQNVNALLVITEIPTEKNYTWLIAGFICTLLLVITFIIYSIRKPEHN